MMEEQSSKPINSLSELRLYKESLSKEIHENELMISSLWNDLFHKPAETEYHTPVQRFTNIMSMGSGVIDGLILGWKLYRKLKGNQFLFKRRRR